MADEERIEFTGFFAQLFGSWYPKHCIVAVIDDEAAARAAVADFAAAGFAEDDVRCFTGEEVTRIDAQVHRQRNAVQRVIARATSGTDEGVATQQYLDAAREGKNIVIVRVGDRDTPDPRVRPIMMAHHAHTIRVYGDLTMAQVGPA